MIEIPDFNKMFLDLWNHSSLVLCFAYAVIRTAFPNVKIIKAIGDCFPFTKTGIKEKPEVIKKEY